MDSNTPHHIAETLSNEILTGHLRPGDLLQQEELARRFGVSRQPVRAALDILGAKGLAERLGSRTVAVRGLHAGAGDEALALRRMLEPQALRLSLPHLTAQDLLAAKQAHERFEIEEDSAQLAEHDTAFHLALYARCDNKMLLDLITDLRLTQRRAYLDQPLGSETRTHCIRAHSDLLDAARAGDMARATALLDAHFDIAKTRSL